MTKSTDNSLMALLGKKAGGTDTWTALAAKTPAHEPIEAQSPDQDAKLQQLLQRINQLTTPADPRKTASPTAAPKPAAPDPTNATANGAVAAATAAEPAPQCRRQPERGGPPRRAGLSKRESRLYPLPLRPPAYRRQGPHGRHQRAWRRVQGLQSALAAGHLRSGRLPARRPLQEPGGPVAGAA